MRTCGCSRSFTAIGVLPTALLAFVGTSDAFTGLTLFVIASIGFWGGLIFYDSMLIRVAPPGRVDSVSGFGYALGYLGGGLLLTVNIADVPEAAVVRARRARRRRSAPRS